MIFRNTMTGFFVRYCVSLFGACVVGLIVAKYVIIMDRQSVSARIEVLENAINTSDRGLAGALADMHSANLAELGKINASLAKFDRDVDVLTTLATSNRTYLLDREPAAPAVDVTPQLQAMQAQIEDLSAKLDGLSENMSQLEGAIYSISVGTEPAASE